LKKLFVLLTTLSCGLGCQAQVGTIKWHFNSRPEVVQALQKTRGNLRATYEVLICAGRQGYTNTSIGFYEDVVAGHNFDASAQDSAAYAYACALGYTFRPWGWKRDTDDSMIKKSSRANAAYFRDRARSLRPDSAEVLIMYSFWTTDQDDETRKAGYEAALKGVNRAPRWADAYYWLGYAADACAGSLQSRVLNKRVKSDQEANQMKAKSVRLARLTIRAYDKAERLDPGMRPNLFFRRLSAYSMIRDKKSAQMIPILVEAQLRAHPDFAAWYRRRTSRDFRESWAETAAKIAAEASS